MNIDKASRGYQPLAKYSAKRIGASYAQDDAATNDAARASIREALAAAGFREVDGYWWAEGVCADIAVDYAAGTIGVEIEGNSASEFYLHMANGTYDALPLAEKHRISGAGGTLESWLQQFDSCGTPRPTDGATPTT